MTADLEMKKSAGGGGGGDRKREEADKEYDGLTEVIGTIGPCHLVRTEKKM